MFKDPLECYEEIATCLSRAAKTPWDRIELNATLDGVRVDAVVGCWLEGKSEAVAYLTDIPRLASHIYDLARLVSSEDKGLFKTFSFSLSKNGTFKTNFVY